MAKYRIGLGVSGGIAAYKAVEVMRLLQKAGCEVSVAMTRHATEFVQPLTFRALTDGPVIVDDYDPANEDPIAHVNFSQNIDLLLITPSAAGDGVVTGLIDLCSEPFAFGTCFGTPLPPAIALVSAVGSFPLASTQTPGLSSYGLLQDIGIDAGVSGSASLQAAQLTFTSVPEPGTAVAFAAGTAALIAFRRTLLKH